MGDFNTSAVGQNSIPALFSFGANTDTEAPKKKTLDENLAANSVWANAAQCAAYMQ